MRRSVVRAGLKKWGATKHDLDLQICKDLGVILRKAITRSKSCLRQKRIVHSLADRMVRAYRLPFLADIPGDQRGREMYYSAETDEFFTFRNLGENSCVIFQNRKYHTELQPINRQDLAKMFMDEGFMRHALIQLESLPPRRRKQK